MNYDPIYLLRKEYSNQNSKINERDGWIHFSNNTKLDFKTPTAWKPLGQQKIYSVGDLFVFLENKREKKSNVQYMMSVRSFKSRLQVQIVSKEHMKDIEE
jgi:hypothetical protein